METFRGFSKSDFGMMVEPDITDEEKAARDLDMLAEHLELFGEGGVLECSLLLDALGGNVFPGVERREDRTKAQLLIAARRHALGVHMPSKEDLLAAYDKLAGDSMKSFFDLEPG